jgi:RecA-family ATPase
VPDRVWDADPELHRQAEDERARHRQSNGHDETWHSLPAIDQADLARWKGKEPPEIVFTIEDLVPQGMVTLMTSIGGAGKTLLMQMAGAIVAAGGMRFLGKATLTGRAAGVFAEDPESVLHIRQPRINGSLGIDYDRLAGRYFPQSYFGLSAQLWRKGEPTPFFAELEDQLSRIKALRLATLDNAALLFAGDENSRSEVTEFMSALNGLADRLGIGIILSAHASKSQDGTTLRVTSGSTAWVNACRSVLELRTGDATGDGGQGPSLVLVKANHAATGTTIPLVWRDKLLVPESAPGGLMGTIYRRAAERVFLDLLDKVTAEGRHVSDSKHASNFAPKLFAGRPGNERYKEADFRRAMETLFDNGEIKMQPYDRKGGKHRCIIRCADPEEAIFDGACASPAGAVE